MTLDKGPHEDRATCGKTTCGEPMKRNPWINFDIEWHNSKKHHVFFYQNPERGYPNSESQVPYHMLIPGASMTSIFEVQIPHNGLFQQKQGSFAFRVDNVSQTCFFLEIESFAILNQQFGVSEVVWDTLQNKLCFPPSPQWLVCESWNHQLVHGGPLTSCKWSYKPYKRPCEWITGSYPL